MSYVTIAWAVISTLRQDELQRIMHDMPWADNPAPMMVAVLLLRVINGPDSLLTLESVVVKGCQTPA